ncbi:MAG: glucan biosynthesis protein G [Vitreoscilla sp.]
MQLPGRQNRAFSSVVLRRLLASAALALASLPACAALFDDVAARARQLAEKPFVAAARPVAASPAGSDALTYDQYRDIRFRPDRSLWRDQKLPFEVQFFHPGFVNTETVRINEVTADGATHPVAFDMANFDYGHNKTPSKALASGYAGFRVHYPINNAAHKDEVIVFLGASYFRAVGKDQRYGLSARGLAVDTVGAGAEEFPRFTEYWLEKPAANATSLTITALMDSRSLTGVYRFVVTPGQDTVVDVQSRLYLRKAVKTLGIAPLTSMFFSGENQPQPGDFRPEVHDSDGLMVQTGTGEWLWRPLSNPKHTLTTSFAMPSLKGFGLMQRDHSYTSYEDDEARYELRPSAWITPVGDWGPGRVELVQLNTIDETNDNIVAYWVPAKLPAPGEPLDLSYRMRWQGNEEQHPPGAWATQSRSGRSFATLGKGEEQVIVDFAGPALSALPADAAVKAVVTGVANVDIVSTNAYRNEANGTWRLAIRFRQRQTDQPVELRAFLQHGNDILSETWTHVIPPR